MAATRTTWRLAISTKAKVRKGERTMRNMTAKIKPTHPGDVLRHEYLEPLGMTPNALAIALRVPASRIGEIVNGKRSITAPTAMRLARYFGSSARFWMNLQSYYDLAVAEDDLAGDVERDVQPRNVATA
jgi:addiction module HigA family antidote